MSWRKSDVEGAWSCRDQVVLRILNVRIITPTVVAVGWTPAKRKKSPLASACVLISKPEKTDWVCLVQESLPERTAVARSYAVVAVLDQTVRHCCPTALIAAYGSLASNLTLPQSDVDLCISFAGVQVSTRSPQWRGKVLKAVADVLFATRLVRYGSFQAILHARVPVISFQHADTGLEVDINTYGDGVFKSGFLRGLHRVQPCFGPLVRVVKQWARFQRINSPKDGTLNSFCLTMLCIFHMQRVCQPLLPPLWEFLPRVGGCDPPLSSHRPLHAGASIADGCLQACLSLQEAFVRSKGAEQAPVALDHLVGGFFVHMAAVMLLRFCGRMGDLTLSCWAGAFLEGRLSDRLARRRRQQVVAGVEAASPELGATGLVRHLLRCVRQHWPSDHSISAAAACANALAGCAGLLSPEDCAALRGELPADDPAPPAAELQYDHVVTGVHAMLNSIVEAEEAALASAGYSAQAINAMTEVETRDDSDDEHDDGRAADCPPDDAAPPLRPTPPDGRDPAPQPPDVPSTTAQRDEDPLQDGATADQGADAPRAQRRKKRRPMPPALFSAAYLLAVEDPFNEEDNTARSVRSGPLFRSIVVAFVSTALSGGSALRRLQTSLLPEQARRPQLSDAAVARRAQEVHLHPGPTNAEVGAFARQFMPTIPHHRLATFRYTFGRLVQAAANADGGRNAPRPVPPARPPPRSPRPPQVSAPVREPAAEHRHGDGPAPTAMESFLAAARALSTAAPLREQEHRHGHDLSTVESRLAVARALATAAPAAAQTQLPPNPLASGPADSRATPHLAQVPADLPRRPALAAGAIPAPAAIQSDDFVMQMADVVLDEAAALDAGRHAPLASIPPPPPPRRTPSQPAPPPPRRQPAPGNARAPLPQLAAPGPPAAAAPSNGHRARAEAQENDDPEQVFQRLQEHHIEFMTAPLTGISKRYFTEHLQMLEKFSGYCKRRVFSQRNAGPPSTLSKKQLMAMREHALNCHREAQERWENVRCVR